MSTTSQQSEKYLYTLPYLRQIRSEFNPSAATPEQTYTVIDDGPYYFTLVTDFGNGIGVLRSISDDYVTKPVNLAGFQKISVQ